MSTPATQYRDPWPSPQDAWLDPPWRMSGRVVTAWFDIPRDRLAAMLSPDLMPEPDQTTRSRLRFYELRFETLSADRGVMTAPREEVFHEAVVAVPASHKGVQGEVSLFMWADSEAYRGWSREAFGWPLMVGSIEVKGELWTSPQVAGSSGSCLLEAATGRAGIDDLVGGEETNEGWPASLWLTPRRALKRGGLDGETRELLAVRPQVIRPGVRHRVTGRPWTDFHHHHPLHRLELRHPTLELVDGFELVVGQDVELL